MFFGLLPISLLSSIPSPNSVFPFLVLVLLLFVTRSSHSSGRIAAIAFAISAIRTCPVVHPSSPFHQRFFLALVICAERQSRYRRTNEPTTRTKSPPATVFILTNCPSWSAPPPGWRKPSKHGGSRLLPSCPPCSFSSIIFRLRVLISIAEACLVFPSIPGYSSTLFFSLLLTPGNSLFWFQQWPGPR